jgi:hypothetical protein
MTVGGIFGAWLLNTWLGGGIWGALAGAFAFACFRPWPTSTPNSDGDPRPPVGTARSISKQPIVQGAALQTESSINAEGRNGSGAKKAAPPCPFYTAPVTRSVGMVVVNPRPVR